MSALEKPTRAPARVTPLAFDDVPFRRESFEGKTCRLCGSADTYLDELFDSATGERVYQCSDTSYCQEMRAK